MWLLLRQQLLQPSSLISLAILALGLARALLSRDVLAGTFSLGLLVLLAFGATIYPKLYYRNVSWGVERGDMVATGVFGGERRIPLSTVRRLVKLRVVSERRVTAVVVVEGEGDRHIASIRGSDEYSPSDLQALADAARIDLVDGGSIALSEFLRRSPGAIARVGSTAAAMNARRLAVTSILFALIVTLVFLVYEVVIRR